MNNEANKQEKIAITAAIDRMLTAFRGDLTSEIFKLNSNESDLDYFRVRIHQNLEAVKVDNLPQDTNKTRAFILTIADLLRRKDQSNTPRIYPELMTVSGVDWRKVSNLILYKGLLNREMPLMDGKKGLLFPGLAPLSQMIGLLAENENKDTITIKRPNEKKNSVLELEYEAQVKRQTWRVVLTVVLGIIFFPSLIFTLPWLRRHERNADVKRVTLTNEEYAQIKLTRKEFWGGMDRSFGSVIRSKNAADKNEFDPKPNKICREKSETVTLTLDKFAYERLTIFRNLGNLSGARRPSMQDIATSKLDSRLLMEEIATRRAKR